MNTILTDDEIRRLWQWEEPFEEFEGKTRAIEAAVLAKLARQEPVAWCSNERMLITWVRPESTQIEDWSPLYTHPAPQQADRQRVPEGWKLVPVEPTHQMTRAGAGCSSANLTWKVMVRAAPESSKKDGGAA